MQLRLSSLICRIIVLQNYTVCFREEARLVRALMSGSNLSLHLALLPACLPALSCSQELEAEEGWPFFSLLPCAAPGRVCDSDDGLAWALGQGMA